jgi:hypothetical protein
MSDSRQFWSVRAGIVEGVSQNSTITSGVAALDDERRYQAAVSKDPRFDGVFFIAVTSTGIYCRPSCPAITPKRANMRFYRSAAAAQEAGFRACKRCRPDASPGSPEWNIRADVVGRAMRLIADGVVDRDGVEGLASRLGYRITAKFVSAYLTSGGSARSGRWASWVPSSALIGTGSSRRAEHGDQLARAVGAGPGVRGGAPHRGTPGRRDSPLFYRWPPDSNSGQLASNLRRSLEGPLAPAFGGRFQ